MRRPGSSDRSRRGLREQIRHRSLRTRLTGVLLALAAIGLVALSAITWGSQRRFLEQRVDDQARSAVRFITVQVIETNKYAALTGTTTSDPFSSQTSDETSGANAGGPPPDGDAGDGGGRHGDLPPGTYGELRTQSGTRIGLAYAQRTLSGSSLGTPKIPAKITYGKPFTVQSSSGKTKYRVVAQLAPTFISTTSGQRAVAVVAIPLTSNSDQLRNLLLVDGVVILLILGALGFAATRLVGVELAPLEHIASDADAIAGGKLDRRVPEAEEGTEVGRLSVALNAMLDRIEEAFAERQASEDKLRQFLSDASHELRTPLASIRGYAELQRTGILSTEEERAQAVVRIEEQAARMGTLVEDLLALARLDEEREHKTELVELALIARDAVSDAGAVDPDREITLEVEGDPLIVGDEARLRQVLMNLLGNAVSHTPAGTPITVSVGTSDDRGVVHVDDAGDGVPEDKRAQIFQRFHREAGGSARTRGPAGAGLGLAVVKGIVTAHGGTVAVGDSPLGGARFTVTLPLADTDDD